MSPTDGPAPPKPKVAVYWCGACGGCDETVLDLNEAILDVAAAVDIVFWPIALDFKRHDVEAWADGAIDVTFVNGAIRTSEHGEMARLLRRKSRLLIAFGACAHLGGIPGLANLWTRDQILETVYRRSPSTDNPNGVLPQTVRPGPALQFAGRDEGNDRSAQASRPAPLLPRFSDTVLALDQVVDVDYFVPGCPPTPELFADAVRAVLCGTLPPRKAVLAPDRAVCDACPRRDSRPDQLLVTEFHRPHEILADEMTCLMAQGVVCLGPATRGGCDSRCIRGNMPCTGCFGPTSRVRDFGAKALAASTSILDASELADIDRKLDALPDAVGTFYRYSLAASLIPRRR